MPVIQLSRDADADPESPLVAVSDQVGVMASKSSPVASAAICTNAVCAPCPTSAPARYSSALVGSPSSPRNTMRASLRSGNPNENPMFLYVQAKPRPRRTVDTDAGNDANAAIGRGSGTGADQAAASAQASTTAGRLTPGRHLGAGDADGALVQQVDSPDLDRVEIELLGQAVHLGLGHIGALGATEATERATRDRGRVHRPRVDACRRDLIGPAHRQVQVPEHLVRGVVVGAGVEVAVGLDAQDAAVARRRPTRRDPTSVAFVVADDRLLAVPFAANRPVDASIGEHLGCQRDHQLQAQVLLAPEGTADRPVDHPHPVERQVEGVRDLLGVLVGPLPGGLDGDPALIIDEAHCGFGLEVGVLLVREVVGAFDDHVGRSERSIHVALADHEVVIGVRARRVLGVHQRCVVRERSVEITHEGQRLPLGDDGLGGGTCDLGGLGDDDGQVVGLPP